MAVEPVITVRDEGVSRALDRLRVALGGDMRKPMTEIGRSQKSSTQQRFREQVSPGGDPWKRSKRAQDDDGQTLNATRRLRNSVTYAATHSGVEWGTNVVYGRIHQFGGTVKAKRSRYLAIPLTAAARNAGSPRRFVGKLSFVQKGGRAALLDEDGEAQYALRRSVKIPARPWLGVSHRDRESNLAIMARHIQRAITG